MSEEIKIFKGQDYNKLKYQHDESNLFEDPFFPANDQSLSYSQMPPQGVRWMRPREADSDAQFVCGDFDRCDIDQGFLGNCWFIAGVVGIMQLPKVFAKVVPSDQSFDSGYSGCFHFRFWNYGQWVDVVVDDRLPFWPDGRLVYCSNKQKTNEYWCSLLEKAYAKLYGSCYEVLDAGQTYDALIDMSGGIQEQFDIKKLESDQRQNFWNILEKGFEKNSIMGCCIFPDPNVKEARMSNGLVRGHAYTITKIVDLNSDKLIRIRNPWGNEVEWKGDWSDGSREWNQVSDSEKQEIGLVFDKDGEFWMSYSDFMSNWDQIQICHLSPESYSDEFLEKNDNLGWKLTMYNSSWVSGNNAGGSGNNDQASFWLNPQFLIAVKDVGTNDNKADLVIALMQKDSRLKRIQSRQDSCEEFIQFKLFKINEDVPIDEAKTTGLRLYGNQLQKIGSSGSYINSREVTRRFSVDSGYYVIIPSTYECDYQKCDFLLRIFSETTVEGSSLDEHKDNLDENDTYFESSEEDFTAKKFAHFLTPKVAKFARKYWDKNEHLSKLNIKGEDVNKLFDHLPEFNGKDLIKHGINSFFS